MKLNRRSFIKTAGGMALAGMAEALPALAALQQPFKTRQRAPRLAVFFEPSFPTEDSAPIAKDALLRALEGWEAVFLGADELQNQLNGVHHDVFINPCGSAFPKMAWQTILQFLRDGGNWVNLGGVPFAVPVVREGRGWRQEVRQTAYHKKLGLLQAFPVSSARLVAYRANAAWDGAENLLDQFAAEEIYELYVRFTATKDFPAEDGTGGPRDAVLRPLLWGIGGDQHKLAAPFIMIDRLQGEFAGGRWMLANFKGTMNAKAIRALAGMALPGAMELTARPSFACYREGELPAFTIQVRRPKGEIENLIAGDCRLEILDSQNRPLANLNVPLHGAGAVATGYANMPLRKTAALTPNLYQVHTKLKLAPHAANATSTISHTTGFWVFDQKLLAGGKPLTADANYLQRDGEPYPVTGTTYMGSDVHRKFLFEPNPHLWNQDFAEMKAAGINMIRTGIWTGWKNYMLDAGAPNEAALRALDAFMLTARKYDIPIIFTFFAFLPETWGGENPYLDPRAVAAQKEFVAAFAHRYREMNDIIWDFINEPSFCSPQHLWSCRPNYDAHEANAWNRWLQQRYALASEEEWRSRLQEQYRAPAGETIALPSLDEFADANIFNNRRPIKVIDYRLFAQESFAGWVKEMAAAVRSNGNPRQLLTVGQDEGGTYERPSNQFFSETVDFTCLHNWWLNDDLLWDAVITKAPGKPNLVEETGVMFYEKMDGSAWRTEEEVRHLLERKMVLSLAAGAGFIQWLWNTNCYMTLDNEAAIGFHRVDGTAKPELQPLLALAKFFAANRHLMQGKLDEEVTMVIPHSQMFSTRNFATEASRQCVRAMHYHCHTPMNAVSEYRLHALANFPKLIVVPSPRTFNQQAWKALLSRVERGATALITGSIDSDEHWLPALRLQQFGVAAVNRPVAQEEFILIDGVEYQLSYRGEKMQRVEKAVLLSGETPRVMMIPHGNGNILWSPLPVEIADNLEPAVALYELALRQAHVAPIFSVEKKNSAVLIRPAIFAEAALYALVSECDRDTAVKLTHNETKTPIAVNVPAQRTAMIFVSRRDGKTLATIGME